MRVEQLRELFGLDASEELYGDYFCAHTKPRWGAQFLHGQLYVFSTCMVFHASLIAVVKAVRIYFKDVKVIRKRKFMRMPNTIALERCDEHGVWHNHVFTSFVFASRGRAYDTMVQRWRAVNPGVAQAYLQGLHYGSELHPRTPLTDTESDGHLHHSHSHQQQEHERTFPCPLQDLLLPAAAAADAAAVPEGVEMREVGGQLLQGDAQQMAQLFLSDTSGFLPHVMAQQGNQLVNITPWRVDGRSLRRTFKYIFSSTGSWGKVRSIVLQQQVLRVFDDGRLLLDIHQTMPELPTGIGKAVSVLIRWDVTPISNISTPATAPPAAASTAATADHGTVSAAAAGGAPSPTFTVPDNVTGSTPPYGSPFFAPQPAKQHTAVHPGCEGGSPRSTAAAAASPPAAAYNTPLQLTGAQQQQQQVQEPQGNGGSCFQAAHCYSRAGPQEADGPLSPSACYTSSFMGLDSAQQQPLSPKAAEAVESSDSSSCCEQPQQQQQLRHHLQAASCPVVAAGAAQCSSSTWTQHQRHSNSSLESDCSGDDPLPAAGVMGGGGGRCQQQQQRYHRSSTFGGGISRGSSFMAGLKGGLKELASPLSSIMRGTAGNGSNSRAVAAAAGGGGGGIVKGDSVADVSVLGSVHEEPAAERAAVAVADTQVSRHSSFSKQQQQQQQYEGEDVSGRQDVAARQLSYSSSKSASRGRDQAGTATATAAAVDKAAAVSEAASQPGSRTPSLLSRMSPPVSPGAVAAALFGGGSACFSPTAADTAADAACGDTQEGSGGGLPSTSVPAADGTGGSLDGPTTADTAAAAATVDEQTQQQQQHQQQQRVAMAGSQTTPASHAAAAAISSGNGSRSSSAMSSSSVEWRVSVGVQWSGWHIAKAKVTEDTHTATAASQKVVLTSGARWMSCPAERLALAEVMPQAGRHTGIRKSHRRSGSAGSAGRATPATRSLSLAAAGGLGRTSSLTAQQRHSMAPLDREQEGSHAASWLSSAGCGLSAVSAAVAGVLRGLLGPSAAGQRVGLVGLLEVGVRLVQLVLLWRVVVLLSVLVEKLDALPAAGTCSNSPVG